MSLIKNTYIFVLFKILLPISSAFGLDQTVANSILAVTLLSVSLIYNISDVLMSCNFAKVACQADLVLISELNFYLSFCVVPSRPLKTDGIDEV